MPHVTRSVINQELNARQIYAAVREHLQTNQALYSLDEELMQRLAPELIVTQALCDVCAVSEQEVNAVLGRPPGLPQLINLEPMTLGEVLDTIELVGRASGVPDRASAYRSALEARVERVHQKTKRLKDNEKPRVGFLEWTDPLFNGGHWTPELIHIAGGIDCFGNLHQPSTTISDETLLEADPDVLIVALCGFDEERSRKELERLKQWLDFNQLRSHRHGNVHVLDGNSYFSRPGPRLVDSVELLAGILHPSKAALA